MSDARRLCAVVAVAVMAGTLPALAATGLIEGRLTTPGGEGLTGVRVTVEEIPAVALTDFHGVFTLRVPWGTYTVTLSAAGREETVENVEVPFDGRRRIDRVLDWDLAAAGTTAVFAPSRSADRLALSPSPVSVVSLEEIARQAAHGQPAKLVELAPAVDFAQSGSYDFGVVTRGFNEPRSSRFEVRVDDRDPSELFFGGQEWAYLAMPLDDLAQVEVVRGAAALHRAPGGVLNLITKRPRQSTGGVARIGGGELAAAQADARWAIPLGRGWNLKLLASARTTEDFALSRVGAAEYSRACTTAGESDCLPQERSALQQEDREIASASVRADRTLDDGGLWAIEGGATDIAGVVQQSQLGRLQVQDANWRWARSAYYGSRWTLLGNYQRRDAGEQRMLATADNLALDEESWHLGVEHAWTRAGGRQRFLVGLSHTDERVDSYDPTGRFRPYRLNPLNQQTLLFQRVEGEADALYAQFDWRLGGRVTLVAGARYDDSDRHEAKTSPRLAVVYSLAPEHVVRLSFNQTFEVPDYSEYFVRADLGDPVNLARFEPVCVLNGVRCGFDVDFLAGEDPALDATPDTRLLAVGNEALELPRSTVLDVGYSGSFGDRVFVQADFHSGEHEDVLSGLLPQLGTSLGRINPAFGFWQAPPGLTAASEAEILAGLEEDLGPLFPFLSNSEEGTPVLVIASFTNLGAVDTQGVDLAVRWIVAPGWTLDLSYSWLDFEPQTRIAGLEDRQVANAPENKGGVALAYARTRWDAFVGARWVDDFRWAYGPFVGNVESYTTVDLAANVTLNRWLAVGLHVANLLDEEHFETFGGDLLGRQALARLSFRW